MSVPVAVRQWKLWVQNCRLFHTSIVIDYWSYISSRVIKLRLHHLIDFLSMSSWLSLHSPLLASGNFLQLELSGQSAKSMMICIADKYMESLNLKVHEYKCHLDYKLQANWTPYSISQFHKWTCYYMELL